MTLTEFLGARLADDRAQAQVYASATSLRLSQVGERMLREAESKRKILIFVGSLPLPEVTDPVLGWMAEAYSGHEDYNEAWRP